MSLKKPVFFLLALFLFSGLHGQSFSVKGRVVDAETKQHLEGVVVSLENSSIATLSGKDGSFSLDFVPNGPRSVKFEAENHRDYSTAVEVNGADINLGTIEMAILGAVALDTKEEFIPTVTLSEDDLAQGADNQNISGILSASRDVFVSAAAFTFGPARFRIRGYDSENTIVYFNGIPVNELENGRVNWSAWSGLNDVMRNRDNDIGLEAIPYGFGGVGGGSIIDTRASNQRKQLRLTYSLSNRTYTNRAMATWSSGPLQGGWAFSLSGSRRWGEEGYIEGTFYDAYSYFLSADKSLGDRHSLNLTAFGAPVKRGRSGASVQEMYDLAGSNYYNPYWGYQNGKKRNSRVANAHQPMFILRHDWSLGNDALLTTAVSYQFGRNGSTALDWFDAPDPRPDYYRYLPSYFRDENQQVADDRTQALMADVDARQIHWDDFFEANRNSQLTEKYAYLLEGQNVQGQKWSQYIVEDRRYDSEEFNFNTNYQNIISDHFTVHFGLSYQQQTVKNFKVVEDLLGGDFTVNVDRFAVRDSIANIDAQQNDLNNPGQILREGDIYGYNYNSNIRKADSWVQGVFTYRLLDFFLAANVSQTSFWRTGNYRTGRFPDNSFGDSEKQNFLNFGFKGGATYKLSGRHYLFANAAYLTRAPYFVNAYVSPRTRDQIIPDLQSEKITSAEAGYYLRSPNIKGKAAAYFTKFENQIEVIRFFNDLERAFGNYTMSGLDKRHLGVELALEAKIFAGLTLSGVAAIGQYVYDSRAAGAIYQDNTGDLLGAINEFTVYSKNFYISGMPQTAYTAGINYNSPKFWFATLNFNYFDNIYIDFSPVRRTEEAVFNLDPESEQFRSIVQQEKVDGAFTVDFFGGKSFKFGRTFLYLNVGVSNILNNKNFITGGYEQLRFDTRERDPNTFPSLYYYSFGTNYFINLSFRI
jgi:hypothetical protein